MSDRLGQQMDQLRRQRLEIENSVRRIGDAFASGLDRQALLGILVETAVGACDADYGLVVLSGHVGAEAEAGEGERAGPRGGARPPSVGRWSSAEPVEVADGDALRVRHSARPDRVERRARSGR